MRRLAPAVGVLALAGCGSAEPPARHSGALPPDVLHRYGVRVVLPDGWHGELGRGALRAASVPLRRLRPGERLAAGVVHVQLFESDPAHDSPPLELVAYRPVEAPPQLTRADYGPPEQGTAQAAAVARRLFRLSGRYFVLFVSAGSQPSTDDVGDVNRLLAGLTVEHGDFYPGTVEPPRFTPRPGWHVGDSGSRPVRADGEWLTAWASTIPYRDPWNGMADETARALPEDGIAIWVLAERNNRFPPTSTDHEGNFALREPPFRLAHFQRHESWEGGGHGGVRYRLLATVRRAYRVDVVVHFGRRSPTATMLVRAQAMLDGLRLPDWGPWELDGR